MLEMSWSSSVHLQCGDCTDGGQGELGGGVTVAMAILSCFDFSSSRMMWFTSMSLPLPRKIISGVIVGCNNM